MAMLSNKPFLPTAPEAAAAKRALEHLQADRSRKHFILGDRTGQRASIPESVYELIVALLGHIAAGDPVVVMPLHAELTTIEAAEFLSVSRPHLIKLLDERQIRHRLVGKHRRILFEDLLKYKESTKRLRLTAISGMVAEDDATYGLED